MKYVDEFRDGPACLKLAESIKKITTKPWVIMEICGGQTHSIARYGLEDLLPGNVRLIHGPGCPVCVLPMGRIDTALLLAGQKDVTLCTYADLMRVPGSNRDSLLKAKAAGADIRMVYSVEDALRIAAEEPGREVVFFAIGFETTTPPTALALRRAASLGLKNFTVFCNHVLTPAAMRAILDPADPGEFGPLSIDGFVGPAHVSTVIGTRPYEFVADEFRHPVVIAGFEPLDVMQAVLMLIRQLNAGRHEIENEYSRAVTPEGNVKAQALMAETLETRESFEWRGLGLVPLSGLRIREAYAGFDAERRFDLPPIHAADHKACECGAILRGVKRPEDCRLFGTACTPETPMGSCMVSSEGACAAHWSFGRFRSARQVA